MKELAEVLKDIVKISRRSDVLRNIEFFEKFGSIPEDLVDKEIALKWFLSSISSNMPADLYFSRIPREFWSDELILTAVSKDPVIFLEINPSDVFDYEALCVIAVKGSSVCIQSINNDFKNESMVWRLAEACPEKIDLCWSGQQWIRPILNDELNKYLLSRSVPFLLSMKDELPWENIRKGLQDSADSFYKIKIDGDISLIERMIGEGVWPTSYLDHPFKHAESLKDGVIKYMRTNDLNLKVAYEVFIKSHPIEDVFKLMSKSYSRASCLLELYSIDEIRPFLGEKGVCNYLKGHSLEHDLGL